MGPPGHFIKSERSPLHLAPGCPANLSVLQGVVHVDRGHGGGGGLKVAAAVLGQQRGHLVGIAGHKVDHQHCDVVSQPLCLQSSLQPYQS